jgi:hypothetical protein
MVRRTLGCDHRACVEADHSLLHLFFVSLPCLDVLMGRGGKNNQYIGNEKLRVLARKRSREYQIATKKGKSQISRELVDAIRLSSPPGRYDGLALCVARISIGKASECVCLSNLSHRFLKKIDDDNWEDVGDEIAREKTAQVLRDAINSVKAFSNMTPVEFDVTTPEVSSMAPTRKKAKAVTHEKSTPLKRQASSERCSHQSSSSGSVSPFASGHGLISDHSKSPAICYSYFRGCNSHPPHVQHNVAAGSNLYPVTPYMSIFPPSAARKRARYHESPLPAEYHRTNLYAGDGSAYSTPNVSYMYGSPPNPRKQGFIYTPPSVSYRMPLLATNASKGGATGVEAPSTLFFNFRKDASEDGMISAASQANAGQPSGESTDCWINDIPMFQAHQKPPGRHHQLQYPSYTADFDPFNDDLLSDSEHQDGSPLFFP